MFKKDNLLFLIIASVSIIVIYPNSNKSKKSKTVSAPQELIKVETTQAQPIEEKTPIIKDAPDANIRVQETTDVVAPQEQLPSNNLVTPEETGHSVVQEELPEVKDTKPVPSDSNATARYRFRIPPLVLDNVGAEHIIADLHENLAVLKPVLRKKYQKEELNALVGYSEKFITDPIEFERKYFALKVLEVKRFLADVEAARKEYGTNEYFEIEVPADSFEETSDK